MSANHAVLGEISSTIMNKLRKVEMIINRLAHLFTMSWNRRSLSAEYAISVARPWLHACSLADAVGWRSRSGTPINKTAETRQMTHTHTIDNFH
jgi:hypothetical protein